MLRLEVVSGSRIKLTLQHLCVKGGITERSSHIRKVFFNLSREGKDEPLPGERILSKLQRNNIIILKTGENGVYWKKQRQPPQEEESQEKGTRGRGEEEGFDPRLPHYDPRRGRKLKSHPKSREDQKKQIYGKRVGSG